MSGQVSTPVSEWLTAVSEKVIETSCAWVFLTGDRALKVKKPVDYGYLDYSTLEKRLWALERELRFNRSAAPDIYRRVVRIGAAGESFELDTAGEPIEYALEMRRFDEDAVLSQRPYAVDGDLADAMGREVARFHAGADIKANGDEAMAYTINSNAELLRKLYPEGPQDVTRLISLTDQAFAELRPLMKRRGELGFTRRCHGDLHLGNILLEGGRPVLFDCIEFNDNLSEIDVLYDLAFLLMDLEFRRRTDAANRVLNAYLDEAARTFGEAVFAHLSLLPLMQSVRAIVRCHVAAHADDFETANAYLQAGLRHLTPAPPRLIAVGGLSGSGKSTFARLVAPGVGGAPGAVVLRSDEIRKRLFGVAPTAHLPDSAYAPGVGERVYARLFEEADLALSAGRAVALDAVFLRPEERAAAEALAARHGCPFHGVWLQTPAAVMEARLAARSGDASDADISILRQQMTRDAGEMAWTRLDGADLPLAARTLLAGL